MFAFGNLFLKMTTYKKKKNENIYNLSKNDWTTVLENFTHYKNALSFLSYCVSCIFWLQNMPKLNKRENWHIKKNNNTCHIETGPFPLCFETDTYDIVYVELI